MSAPIQQSENSSGLSLAIRLLDDSSEAWQEFVDLYGPLIESWCRQAGLATSARADVGQEVFLSVYRSIARFDPRKPGATFRGWLWTITRNTVRAWYRRPQPTGQGGSTAAAHLQQIPDFEDPSLPMDPPSEVSDISRLLARALDQIRPQVKPETWDAFWNTVVLGRPAPEVAEELGLSAASVRQAKSRLLRRLRKQLGEL